MRFRERRGERKNGDSSRSLSTERMLINLEAGFISTNLFAIASIERSCFETLLIGMEVLERGKNRFKRFIFGRRAWPARVRSGVHRASNRFFEGETVNDQVSNDSPASKVFWKRESGCVMIGGGRNYASAELSTFLRGLELQNSIPFQLECVSERSMGSGSFWRGLQARLSRRRKRLFVLRKRRIKITRYEKSSKPRKMYPLEKAKSFLAVVSNDKSRK